MDPWAHFHHHGRHEGRFASPDHLDSLFDDWSFRLLQAQARNEATLSPDDQHYLNWVMARRHAIHSDWSAVVNVLAHRAFDRDLEPLTPFSHLPRLLYCDALCRLGQIEAAELQLQCIEGLRCADSDRQLMAANLSKQKSVEAWLTAVNALFSSNGCLPISLTGSSPNPDQLDCQHTLVDDGPLVSVLMAAWNAEAVLDTALSGLLNQTHRNLEVIVVDDASSDATAAIATKWAKLDPRVRLLQQKTNQGPYAARNWAIEHARGEFITVHDSDDWSHPQKLATQVKALMHHPKLKATQSAWVRVSEGLYFGGWDTPASWLGWVHRNTSSLMMRRAVFEELGYWDEVRCSADVEYVDRIVAKWGHKAIEVVSPHIPLAFGRVGEHTLTRAPETHLLSALKGLRHDYHRAYAAWHAQAQSTGRLYMPRSPKNRPFEIADNMRVKQRRD